MGNWLYGFSSICLFVLFNPFIELSFGADYLFDPAVVFIIVFNFYLTGMRQAVLTFRDAFGIYWQDRYKPLFESVINLVVSIGLASVWGIFGVFIGTAVSTLTTCFWVESVYPLQICVSIARPPLFCALRAVYADDGGMRAPSPMGSVPFCFLKQRCCPLSDE